MTQPPGNSAETPMRRALRLAEAAAALGEVPVGAVVIDRMDGRIVAAARH